MAEKLTMQEVIEHCDKTTRLMERVFTCVHDGGEFGQIESKGYLEHKQTSEWLRELQKYKELEEQRRLIELPCAVGDTVYDIVGIAGKGIRKQIVDGIEYMEDGFFIYANEDEWLGRLGDLVFLTKEEAEAKLKELRGAE